MTQKLWDDLKAAVASKDTDAIRHATHAWNRHINRWKDGEPTPPKDVNLLKP